MPQWMKIAGALMALAGAPVTVYVNLSNQITAVETKLDSVIEASKPHAGEKDIVRDQIASLRSEIAVLKNRISEVEKDENVSTSIIGELRESVWKLEIIVSLLGGEDK